MLMDIAWDTKMDSFLSDVSINGWGEGCRGNSYSMSKKYIS